MKLSISFLMICLFSLTATYAQKNNPVAGHSARLIDLLKKDYGQVSPELRRETIAKDRAEVLSIFTTYVNVNKPTAEVFDLTNSSDTAQQDFLHAKNYFNSIKLLKNIDNNELDSAYDSSILKENAFYSKLALRDTAHFDKLSKSFPDNPYLTFMVAEFKNKYDKVNVSAIDPYAEVSSGSTVMKTVPFFGGNISFETLIDGFSRFMVKRIKEELNTYVVDRIKRTLEEGNLQGLDELKAILPRTTKHFMEFDVERTASFVEELKQFIKDDFNSILTNLPNLQYTTRFRRLLIEHPNLSLAFEGLSLLPRLKEMKTPMDYFNILENSRTLERWGSDLNTNNFQYNTSKLVDFTSLIGNSVVFEEQGEKRFINLDFVNSYGSERNYYLLYVGFLYQQSLIYHDIEIRIKKDDGTNKNINFSSILSDFMDNSNPDTDSKRDDLASNVKFFQGQFSKIGEKGEAVYNLAKDIRKQNKDGHTIGADTVHAFIENLVQLSESTLEVSDTLLKYILSKTKPNESTIFQSGTYLENAMPYLQAVRGVNNVVLDFHNDDYAMGILKAIEIPFHFRKEGGTESSELYSTLSLAADAVNGEMATHWSVIREDLLNAGGAGIKKKKLDKDIDLRASIIRFAEDLQMIEEFIKSNSNLTTNTADKSTCDMIKSTRMLVLRILTDTDPKIIVPNNIEILLKNDNFKKWTIAYFVNANIDALEKNLLAVFGNNADANFINTMIKNWYKVAYDYAFLGEDNKEEALKSTLENIKTLAFQKIESDNFTINPNVLKLIYFINDMAVSEDAEEIAEAFERFALPSGSYAIKRNSFFNASINTYPGLWLGQEYVMGEANGAFSTGVTVPVGLNFSWGLRKCGGSLGLFIPIVDVGAVTRFRFDSTNATAALPEFTFKNILSPGVHFVYEFKNSPLNISVFAQYGPQLKSIDLSLPEGASFKETYHFGAALTLDIPIWNIYTKPYLKFK